MLYIRKILCTSKRMTLKLNERKTSNVSEWSALLDKLYKERVCTFFNRLKSSLVEIKTFVIKKLTTGRRNKHRSYYNIKTTFEWCSKMKYVVHILSKCQFNSIRDKVIFKSLKSRWWTTFLCPQYYLVKDTLFIILHTNKLNEVYHPNKSLYQEYWNFLKESRVFRYKFTITFTHKNCIMRNFLLCAHFFSGKHRLRI